jgi:hypothetical protein
MSERRVETRMLCSELVDVHWVDTHGRRRQAVANLEDISTSGLCLQMDGPIRLDTVVRICHPKGEFRGVVRYCLYREIGYFLGVQFLPGCAWSPEQYQPQYLLDLRTLVDLSAERAVSRPDKPEPDAG